jgi:hypothetical protein
VITIFIVVTRAVVAVVAVVVVVVVGFIAVIVIVVIVTIVAVVAVVGVVVVVVVVAVIIVDVVASLIEIAVRDTSDVCTIRLGTGIQATITMITIVSIAINWSLYGVINLQVTTIDYHLLCDSRHIVRVVISTMLLSFKF